ncbi:unnamed protein product [Oikopleura dioica]|uniref:Uncharacterized protein n=1 Tax=Oikopleura dioica TaxID=34765 RepID=E4YL01_OIKDI|nr:unnamed protein product [Oikopleura dioica]
MVFWLGSAEFDREKKHRLDGKLVAITGASCGIGLSTATLCAQRGASLLLLCRNLSKMSNAAEQIREKAPSTQILEFQLDLADTKTVSNAIKDIKMREIKIDILVLNAGLYFYEPTECLYNINSIQVVNHYSHFYLLHELLENLKGSEDDPARVVALSSMAHNGANADGTFWKTYSSPEELATELGTGIKKIGMKAYCESKLANILHMREMAKRYPEIKFMSVHPGVVNSEFGQKIAQGESFKGTWLGWFMNSWLVHKFFSTMIKSSDQGAQTSMYCICAPEAESWHYYKECATAEVKIKGSKNINEAQEELWQLSMKFIDENCKN